MRRMNVLPATHGVVSVEHLLAKLTVLDPARELNVCELISQKFGPQEPLGGSTHVIKEAASN